MQSQLHSMYCIIHTGSRTAISEILACQLACNSIDFNLINLSIGLNCNIHALIRRNLPLLYQLPCTVSNDSIHCRLKFIVPFPVIIYVPRFICYSILCPTDLFQVTSVLMYCVLRSYIDWQRIFQRFKTK